MLHPRLDVRPVAQGLNLPTTMAFLGARDMLVLEKNTGTVKRVVNGTAQDTVLDLAVNFGSERGLLGIALHPDFPADPGVYLYWTESTTGADTNVLSATPLLGNRVDRYDWTGSALAFDHNLIRLRAIQQDAGQPERGNHDGGILAFGNDGKLYVFIGDVGRRGHLQNLPCGPTATCPGPTVPDDQFGGPEPDDAHLTGVVLRLEDDGTTPTDNPFFAAGAAIGGEVGANVQKVFAYGHRNSFGMAVDHRSGGIWLQENGDDSFSELNRVEPGTNGGWVQIAGPVDRIAQYKQIETTFGTPPALQQLRWPPTNIADTPSQALSRLFMLPARTTATRSSAGSGRSHPVASASWTAAASARSSTATCSSAPRRRTWPAATCSTSTSPATAPRSASTTHGWTTAWPTTWPSTTSPRARACSSAATSASSPTSRPGPTATSTWCRCPTARSTRSSGVDHPRLTHPSASGSSTSDSVHGVDAAPSVGSTAGDGRTPHLRPPLNCEVGFPEPGGFLIGSSPLIRSH